MIKGHLVLLEQIHADALHFSGMAWAPVEQKSTAAQTTSSGHTLTLVEQKSTERCSCDYCRD